jgi:uncharacterized protein (TIGR03437 family)
MRIMFLFLLTSGFGYGQFSGLAVTDDGAQLYFATSLRLKTETPLNLPSTQAVYRTLNGSIERFTDVPQLVHYAPISNGNPQTSGNGEVVSYTRTTECIGGSSCYSHPTTYYSFLAIGGQAYGTALGGNAQISRNGRYVVNDGVFNSFGPTQFHELRDLQNGTATKLPIRASSPRQAVTRDGQVLGFDLVDYKLKIWSSQNLRVLATTKPPVRAIINDTAQWVLYVASDKAMGTTLHSFELSSSRDLILAHFPDLYEYNAVVPTISNDGTTVLYLDPPQTGGQPAQIWLVRPDGTGRRQLTSLTEAVTEAVLAGSGKTAIAATSSGRILRIDTATGAIEEVISKTPVYYIATSLVPGSAYAIHGGTKTMLTESAITAPFPLPAELGGIRVLIDGMAMPIVSVAPETVWYQVPFGLAPADSATFEIASQSVFGGYQVRIAQRAVSLYNDSRGLVLAHEDFGSLVTSSSPALPREVVHAWAAGLGEVMPQLETGVPTPLNRLYPLSDPLQCQVGSPPNSAVDAEVVFAGLAPGMLGVYQIDVRMPESFADSFPYLACGGDRGWFNAFAQ